MKEIKINVDNYNENSIKTIEGDNLSEVYKIYICKNKRRIDLTNKIAIMAYVNEYRNKKSNILALNITNASQGEIELPITNVISSENGVYACQIAIYGENNFLEQTAPFSLIVENNIFSKISNAAINSSDFNILSEAIKTTNEYGERLKQGTENIELQYANKLNKKMNKDDVLSMANMGQDIKEAMTGGSVAVVGVDAVDNINVKNNSLREEKLAYTPQRNFLTNGIEMYATKYQEYFDIRILSEEPILYYYDSYGKLIKNYTVSTKQYNLSNYNSLIWDLLENSIKIIPDGQNLPDKHVKLLHNSVNHLDSGVLLEYVRKHENDSLYKSENAFCYFQNPSSLYVSTKGKYIKKLWIKWDGNITLREVDRLISSQSFDEIAKDSTMSNSLNDNKNCITLEDGECFVFKYSTNKFHICKWQEFDYKKHILLLRNTDGCPIDGLFINHINNNIQLDTDINYKKIPNFLKGYIQGKKIEVLKKQNEDTVCLAHISDIHTTEYTGYQIMRGVSVLNEFIKALGVQATINSGDNIMYEKNKDDALSNSMRVQERIFNKNVFLNAIGNHDSNGWNDSQTQNFDTFINDKELYAILGQNLNDTVVWGDKVGMYYYYDVPNSNIRIITLNSNNIPYIKLEDGNIKHNPNFVYNYSQKQVDFLVKTLKESNDKHILINVHIPLLTDAEGMKANYTMPHNNNCILGILKAFKEGTSFDYTNEEEDFKINLSCNFENKGTIIGVFCGHIHYDCLINKDNINHISINCDMMDKWTDSQPDRIFNTTSQFCFDVLTINTNTKKVEMTRVGAGEDREFNY